jgi:hypothetical protein
MPRYLATLTIVLLLGIMLARVAMLRRQGVRAMNFGKQDKTDFLIPPFAFFYFYLVLADAFGWRTVTRQRFFASGAAGWLAVAFCLAGLLLLFWSLVSFGRSFRVGMDDETPDKLVTGGVFAWLLAKPFDHETDPRVDRFLEAPFHRQARAVPRLHRPSPPPSSRGLTGGSPPSDSGSWCREAPHSVGQAEAQVAG